MTKEFKSQVFTNKEDRFFGHVYEDMEFTRCVFDHCLLSVVKKPRNRTVVRNLKLVQTKEDNCFIFTPIIEDVLVDGLKTDSLLISWGAAYKHVKLQGNIDRIMISPAIDSEREEKTFNLANDEYYKGVD